MKTSITALREVWYIVRNLPDILELRLHRFVMSLHKPEDVGDPGKPHPYCPRCRTDWPCDVYQAASVRAGLSSGALGQHRHP